MLHLLREDSITAIADDPDELLKIPERNVETLAQLTGLSIASTSQHLQQLRQAGLFRRRRRDLRKHNVVPA